MTIASSLHQKFLAGTAITAAGTALFYTTGIDWSWARDTENLLPGIIIYLVAACFGALPYGLLAALLIRTHESPFFQGTVFALVVALPVVAFGWWRLQGIRTNGWDFFLVPSWQLVLLVALYGAYRVAELVAVKRAG